MKIFFIFIIFLRPAISICLDVYESELTKNAIIIELSPEESMEAKQFVKAELLGEVAARKLLALVGIPESVTGKVAGIGVWFLLTQKFSIGIHNACKNLTKEMNVSLKYEGVNIEGVRKIWKLSGFADEFIPGSELTKTLIKIINELLNFYLVNVDDMSSKSCYNVKKNSILEYEFSFIELGRPFERFRGTIKLKVINIRRFIDVTVYTHYIEKNIENDEMLPFFKKKYLHIACASDKYLIWENDFEEPYILDKSKNYFSLNEGIDLPYGQAIFIDDKQIFEYKFWPPKYDVIINISLKGIK